MMEIRTTLSEIWRSRRLNINKDVEVLKNVSCTKSCI